MPRDGPRLAPMAGSSRISTGKGKGKAKDEGGGGVKVAGRFGRGAKKDASTPKDKARAAQAKAAKRSTRKERFAQLRAAFTATRKADARMLPLVLVALLVPFALLLVVGLLVGHPVLLGFLGLMLGLVAATAVFGRRVQGNAYSQVEGQLGAAAGVLNGMRGDWRVTPMVGFNREQDMVHRVVGRPGVVLVGEGSPSRARSLLVNEKKKLARFVGETPVYDVLVGDGQGQVPLRALEKHFAKLPRNVKPREVNILDRKLKAMAPSLPIPKGPVPRGGRMPRQR